MRTRGERDFEVLEALEASDLRPEIERRMAEPAMRRIPAGPTAPWRRAAVAAVALAVFAAVRVNP